MSLIEVAVVAAVVVDVVTVVADVAVDVFAVVFVVDVVVVVGMKKQRCLCLCDFCGRWVMVEWLMN